MLAVTRQTSPGKLRKFLVDHIIMVSQTTQDGQIQHNKVEGKYLNHKK